MSYVLSVPAIHCGRCISSIEEVLMRCEGVDAVRVNLTLRRVGVTLRNPDADPCVPADALTRLGFPATGVDPLGVEEPKGSREATELLIALAVAGFAASNIMMLSVSVWAGAVGDARALFHLVSGAIAVPVVVYSGRPFFRSAVGALARGRVNMEVPISLAVLLTLGLSLFELWRGGDEVFFDAAVALLFFLLIGRYLDRLMRDRARSAVLGLTRLAAKGAMRVGADGGVAYLPLDEIAPGMVLRIAAGERVPVDACVLRGATDMDRSLVTGESMPARAGPGDRIEAGTLNLTGAVDVRALRSADASYLADVGRMLEAAEAGRGRYVRIADRAAGLYAPVVHLLALATFAGWLAATGGDWRTALFVAISVLIITCPCALGLAVPIVHVVAAGRLFREGILMKDGSGLERLAEIDRAVLDKTGTLTTGTPRVVASGISAGRARALAHALATHSTHPAAKAVAGFLEGAPAVEIDAILEIPGQGIEGRTGARRARLGSAAWVAEIASDSRACGSGPAFALEGEPVAEFVLSETLRKGAGAAIGALTAAGLAPEILSGDSEVPVAAVARQLGIEAAAAGCGPAGKIAHLHALRAAGRKVLMVGDGLNDAPALAAGHVSMAPASASDVGRLAADFVFTRESLMAVPTAHAIALRAARLVRQNFGLAVVYNCVAIPMAVAGLVTPLVAALAMSASSILVVGNSLRLSRRPVGALRLAAQDRREAAA